MLSAFTILNIDIDGADIRRTGRCCFVIHTVFVYLYCFFYRNCQSIEEKKTLIDMKFRFVFNFSK